MDPNNDQGSPSTQSRAQSVSDSSDSFCTVREELSPENENNTSDPGQGKSRTDQTTPVEKTQPSLPRYVSSFAGRKRYKRRTNNFAAVSDVSTSLGGASGCVISAENSGSKSNIAATSYTSRKSNRNAVETTESPISAPSFLQDPSTATSRLPSKPSFNSAESSDASDPINELSSAPRGSEWRKWNRGAIESTDYPKSTSSFTEGPFASTGRSFNKTSFGSTESSKANSLIYEGSTIGREFLPEITSKPARPYSGAKVVDTKAHRERIAAQNLASLRPRREIPPQEESPYGRHDLVGFAIPPQRPRRSFPSVPDTPLSQASSFVTIPLGESQRAIKSDPNPEPSRDRQIRRATSPRQYSTEQDLSPFDIAASLSSMPLNSEQLGDSFILKKPPPHARPHEWSNRRRFE